MEQKFSGEHIAKLVVDCPSCEREIRMELRLISGVVPDKPNTRFPHVRAFLDSATKIHWTWGFDEQQASGIHQHFDKKEFKQELEYLLNQITGDPAAEKGQP